MGERRKSRAAEIVKGLPVGTLLDIGTGRGELLDIAEKLGFQAQGTEVVKFLLTERVKFAEAHSLP
jgi:cyclopropane fatty-acyl-phospholipid synthase-like methyltransferase